MSNATPFDAGSARYAVRTIVKIQTPPEWDPRKGVVRPGQLWGFDSTNGPSEDLISVTTSKALGEPCGRFTLTFVPRERDGYTWADLVPGYSLVEIWAQRYPTNPEPVLLMLGLTSASARSEDYSSAQPRRTVQISGRELSCIFVDQRVLYLPVPPERTATRQAGEILEASTDDLGRTFGSRQGPAGLPATASPSVAAFGMLAIDPELAARGDSPVDAIDRFVKMVTVGTKSEYNPDGLPLLNFEFPDAKLRELVFFDRAKASALLFDPGAELPAAGQLSVENAQLWNLMETWSDGTYQELFTETRDLSLANPEISLERVSPASIEVVFRKKPFAGRIDGTGAVYGIAPPSGTQFDRDFAQDPAENILIDGSDVISLSIVRAVDRISNVYLVYPIVPGISSRTDFRALHQPLVDDTFSSPSSMRRFGPRLLERSDYYLRIGEQFTPAEPAVASSPAPPEAFARASARQELLRAWHRFEPLFWRGTYTLKGDPHLRIGKRMVDRGSGKDPVSREYYVSGVSHSIVVGGQQPTFISRVSVERGWDLPEAS